MSEIIGSIWQEGENLASRGEIHEALVQFQKAKALLIIESQNNFSGQTNSRVTQILGEIMMKLTASVEKNLLLMNKNPVLCLKLKKGFTKKDVKRAYKQQALKYHPDKNPDCDTSCIFTAVQSAYEVLLNSAPADPAHEHSQDDHPPRSAGRRRNEPERDPVSKSPQKAQYHSSFRRRPSDPGSNGFHQTTDINPETTKPHQQASSNPNIDREQASGVAQMSTEQIRKALSKIGFTRLEGCSREELVRKYLAAKCHFSTPSQETSQETFGESWGEKMNKRMNRERKKEWRREDAQSKKETSSSQKQTESDPPDVSILSISELKKLCALRRNIQIEHCVEKSELINLLYKSYGVDPSVQVPPRDTCERPASASYHQEKARPPSSSKTRAPPPSGISTSGNPMHNLWTRDRLREMEAKLRRSNRKEGKYSKEDSAHHSNEEHAFDDWTPLDKHLAEEAQKSKFVSKTSDVTALEEELLKAQKESVKTSPSKSVNQTKPSPQRPSPQSTRISPPKGSPLRYLLSSDSESQSDSTGEDDSEEIEWKPAFSSQMADACDNQPDRTSHSPGLNPNDLSFHDLNIPSHGLGDDLDEDDVEGCDEEDEDDEESIFLNPEMTPTEIKAMRLKKFGLNYQRSLSSSSPEKGRDPPLGQSSHLHQNLNGKLQGVHVGVTLLDDDGSDEDEIESDGDELINTSISARFSGRKGSLSSSSFPSSPSATAWR